MMTVERLDAKVGDRQVPVRLVVWSQRNPLAKNRYRFRLEVIANGEPIVPNEGYSRAIDAETVAVGLGSGRYVVTEIVRLPAGQRPPRRRRGGRG